MLVGPPAPFLEKVMTEDQLIEIEARHERCSFVVTKTEWNEREAFNAHTDRAALVEEVRRLREALRDLTFHAQAQLDYMDLCNDKGDLERNLRQTIGRALKVLEISHA